MILITSVIADGWRACVPSAGTCIGWTSSNGGFPTMRSPRSLFGSIPSVPSCEAQITARLLITYDEHGGCYDHVAPSAAVPPQPPVPGQTFGFDRYGVRVPAVHRVALCGARHDL